MSKTVTNREVLTQLLEADSYPRQGNTDWDHGRRLEAAALVKGEGAIGHPDDPPEFRAWLDALRRPGIGTDEREMVYDAMYDFFEATDAPAL